ncbi:hypothetical protein SODALDRAFT_337521 [Sodiomyces alkalinus F11]|uniref:Chromatin-remodeling ATPase INO80 n=1 Tax=Sodiomyces alkalinus (strain CBS 110278 / VKM F-3762 / F11) TaxID=1314773 RepID=A0A3N2PM22_SODAK|nr:hypothetical protein SODALDRAFT_337521 [Sodiomyces alkalinus F11]ROT35575.1 hypothetical protein SODALDRAFT_337521 [Sodiomyces alkalinus F11]
MEHPKDFRSTVLQAPLRQPGGGDDGERRRDYDYDYDQRDRDRDHHNGESRRHRHDLSSIIAPPPSQSSAPPSRHASFSLRSPPRSEFQHAHHTQTHGHTHSQGQGQGHGQHVHGHGHYSSPQTPSDNQAAAAAATATTNPFGGASSATSSSGPLQGPPLSPLHPPSGAYYPPPESKPKPATSSYYDPLTDSTRERKVSDAGSRYAASSQPSPPKPRDPYNYSQPPPPADHQQTQNHSYYTNGNYTSPVSAASTFVPRSPHSHSHARPTAQGSLSPSNRPQISHLASPSTRHTASPGIRHVSSNTTTPHVLPQMSHAHTDSPLKAPAPPPPSSSSRAADPMSFSNILSNSEPVTQPPRKPSPPPVQEKASEPEPELAPEPAPEPAVKRRREVDTETEPDPEPTPRISVAKAKKAKADKQDREDTPVVKEKKKAPRKSKSRASDIRGAEATPKNSRRVSTANAARDTPTPRVPVKRQVNGQPKQKVLPADKEKRVLALMAQLDAEVDGLDESDLHREEAYFYQRSQKRRRIMQEAETRQNAKRRDYVAEHIFGLRLAAHADLSKRRYDEIHFEEALQEVREREVHAEKERKKDMQRKRRREKSMAVTIEAKNAALEKARLAEDESEKARYLRDAERASKKAQQTKLILQKGIKGPARNIDLNLEGGTMSTFQASDMEPGVTTPSGTKTKGKGRSGTRPKKSKEQKQAEKESAEAAQAALDAGEELPSKEESKIRIKISKSKSKDKDSKDKDKDKDKDKEKDKDKDKDRKDKNAAEGDKENKQPKEPKEKEKEKKVEEPPSNEARFLTKGYNQIYDQIWRDLARKDSYQIKSSNLKKTAILASKEAKRWQLRTNKGTKDQQARAKRRNEREERDLRKAAEKQELENARKEEADREAARQKRKLNFLISQTELYSHFIGKKIRTAEVERSTDNPEIAAENTQETERNRQLDVQEPTGVGGRVTNFENLDFDAEDETALREAAMANAQNAIAEAQRKAREFNNNNDADLDEEGEMNFQNPTGLGEVDIEQPKLINAQLKEYQLKGLNWLANLYEQGINGILADEMGLGKTVQSISVMAYLAEKYDIWGPFLVVAPASTLHNWEQEIRKFVPEFKILPYWGSAGDRKVLRKFWDRKHTTYRKDASFHVCVTSYQLVVSDVAYFQKMRWQYMILDEAQAIKSSQSSRWKSLLNFHCRNRLLLTGTPIQNNMQELWALLHFIMPSLFDSHDEFSEWFSKDIESHAQSNTKLNEDQLKRLHMILKPFMLRRVKKHVQKELGDKIEKDVFCDLTYRQRAYYSNLRNQISIMDLIEKATTGDDNDSGTLMNLVMQFRKVCNHPDLFERADTTSPFSFGYFAETASFVREGNNVTVGYSTRNLIEFELPRLVWQEGGRLYRAGNDNDKAGWRGKYMQHLLNVWSPDNVQESTAGTGAFSWLRFADSSAAEVYKAGHQDIFARSVSLAQDKQRPLGRFGVVYDEPGDQGYTPAHALLQITARNDKQALAEVTEQGVLAHLMRVSREKYDDSGLGRLELAARPRASAPPIEVSCRSQGTKRELDNILFNIPMRKALFGPTPVEERALVMQKVAREQYPPAAMLPAPDNERTKLTNIVVPSMRRFVTDSGKLAVLDRLLFKLKNEGHRVLLYFQMTRMIDLMEEYLTYRNYKYCRLDGSTKLEDRRDTVHDFQTRPDIFVFLLSTRAGGLGINLTSADTVIFYDSDWNPTIDSQAMDRAHRLGQTRQVTVYRLITRGTIEERIRKRALQKEEVQRVVIQGGGASVDFSGRRAPENRNRDIAMWLADDEQAEMIERREKELLESGEYDKQLKKKGGKRKRTGGEGGVSLDDMYHEGEGHFDDKGASGTATPVVELDGKGPKKRRTTATGGKKAKTLKQRLAVADGEMG